MLISRCCKASLYIIHTENSSDYHCTHCHLHCDTLLVNSLHGEVIDAPRNEYGNESQFTRFVNQA